MFLINVKFNKTAFIIITISDLFLLFTTYHIIPNVIFVCVLAVITIPLKYFMFALTFRYLNRRNLYISMISLLFSMIFELMVCLKSTSMVFQSFLFYKYIPEIIALFLFPFTFILKILFLLVMIILKRCVIAGVDIPVSKLDGNYRRKIDEWADKLPGL